MTEPDENAFERLRESDSYYEFLAGGLGRLIAFLAWPVVVVILALLAQQTLLRLFPYGVRRTDTKSILNFVPIAGELVSVTSQDQQQAAANATLLRAAFAGFPLNPTPAAVMRDAPPPALSNADRQAALQAQIHLGTYFGRVFSSMQATQLQLVRSSALRPLTTSEAQAVYRTSVARGYPRRFEDWADVIVRFALVDRAADGGTATRSTIYSISDVGRLYLGWCDAQAFTDRTLEAQGRGF